MKTPVHRNYYIILCSLVALLLYLPAGCGGKVDTLINGRQGTAITWDVPVSNVDGAQITDLAGYRIHFGTEPGVYTGSIDVAGWNVTQYSIYNFLGPVPQVGTVIYVTVTARDNDNNESAYSNEITITIVEPETSQQTT